MNIRIPLLATLFGGILTVSTQAQTITAPVGQSLTVTNPIDITVAGGTLNVPSDGAFNVGGSNFLKSKTGGNIFLGLGAGNTSTTAINNIFVGPNTGFASTTGRDNAFIGNLAGYSNTTGEYNMFLGANSGQSNIGGSRNIFLGVLSGYLNTSGVDNFFMGFNAGAANTAGSFNVYLGTQSGNTAQGNYNTCIGYASGSNTASGSQNTFIGYGANGSGGIVNSTAIGFLANVTASNSIVLGNGNQNIGIGNTAPSAKLELTSGIANTSGLKFSNLTSSSNTTTPSGTAGKVLSVDGSGNVILVQIAGATTSSVSSPVAEKTWKEQDGYLYNNSTNGVVINGTGLDGNSLIVKGGVLSKEVNVKVEGSESWPDYVFKPSYKRMTLDEVEKFINLNGHLPNVASATEMAATGNNLNKTDIKLLEKVEELTLYLLEMKKSNEAQNAEIQNLKKQVKSLRRK